MKKTLKAILSILTGTVMCSASMTTFAEYDGWNDEINRRFYEYIDDTFTLTTDTFDYSTGFWGMTLENELLNTDRMYMISGIERYEDDSIDYLILTAVNQRYGYRAVTSLYLEEWENYNGETIQLGDFVRYLDACEINESVPPVILRSRVEYLGHGTDIFGEEFQKVIRHEWISKAMRDARLAEADITFDVVKGDATEDEKVNILDVITINRSIVGKTSLNSYSQYVSDVNGDGAIDGFDSMNIMRYIVGLIDSPDAQ